MTDKLKLDIGVLLPEVTDARDACVARLVAALEAQPGVVRAHIAGIDGPEATLCLHFDPQQVTIAEVRKLAAISGASIATRYGHAVFPIRVVGSEDVFLRIESALSSVPGVLAATVNTASQSARVEFDREQTSAELIEQAIVELGYAPASVVPEAAAPTVDIEPPTSTWYGRNHELLWSLMAGAMLTIAWTGTRWLGMPHGIGIALYISAYVFGSYDLVRHAFADLRKGRIAFDIDLLTLLAAIGAAILGEWAEGALLLFLFSLAHALEHAATGRARSAIKALGALAPRTARVIRDAVLVDVPVEDVRRDEVVSVRPSERIPVDGVVVRGESAVNQAPITGESMPIDKVVGASVFAGTVNGDGSLEIRTTNAVGDRTLDRVVQLVTEAQTQKAPTQQFTDRFERVFVPTVLVGDFLLIALPPMLGIWPLELSFYRGMAVLVAASPCALALGTPVSVLAGIAQAARNGVLIKGGAHLEQLGRLRAMAFDKTGTLTVGQPEVTDVAAVDGVDSEELLRVAAAVERQSQHPLALAVVRRAEAASLTLPEVGALTSITARGVQAQVAGALVEIGSSRLWQERGEEIPQAILDAVATLQGNGRSTMIVKHGDRWLGTLGLSDQPRANVRPVLESLRGMGIRPLVMLTGDNRGVAEAIAAEVGVDAFEAELLPEDKVSAIRALREKHGEVAMVGDGVNDAPALAHATVGIAMGGAGTAVALETADIALMGDDLGKLPFAVGISRQARRIIQQNLWLSLAIIAGLLAATATGASGIGLAVLIHEGSTLVVLANALRLLAYDG
jgi:Cd2+/Zn2+-exporting ATPase